MTEAEDRESGGSGQSQSVSSAQHSSIIQAVCVYVCRLGGAACARLLAPSSSIMDHKLCRRLKESLSTNEMCRSAQTRHALNRTRSELKTNRSSAHANAECGAGHRKQHRGVNQTAVNQNSPLYRSIMKSFTRSWRLFCVSDL